jgi:glycerol transport system ATP-binding protein
VLDEGSLLQFGPTAQGYRRPRSLAAARAFSDPPLNVMRARFNRTSGEALLGAGLALTLPARCAALIVGEEALLAARPHSFSLTRTSPRQAEISGRVELAEISGSETYVHLARENLALIAQAPGVHDIALNEALRLYIDPADLLGFDLTGALLFAPEDRPDGAH